jgi:hypothetical protein
MVSVVWRWGQRIDRVSLLRATLLACTVLGLALPGPAGATSGYATITNVSYEATQPSAPASCSALPSLSGSGSESYATPNERATWEWTVPATLTAGASAHIKVTSQSLNNGGSDAAIAMKAPQEFGTTPSSPSQIIATVPVGAPGSASQEQSYTFNPTRDFVAGEKLYLRIEFGCANFVYEYTGHAAPSICSALTDTGFAQAAQTCPAPLPLTPSTSRPRAGVTTSYAAPQDFTHPVTIPAVAIQPNDVSATVEIGMSSNTGKLLSETDFLAAVSRQNVGKASRICDIYLIENTVLDKTEENVLSHLDLLFNQYPRCVSVVSQILERAEKLHSKSPTPEAIDATAPCRSGSARRKGAGAAPVRLSCARTRAGVRITIRPKVRGAKLRSVIGSSPSLIIGRLRSTTEPVQAGDRVKVRWTTSTR